MIVTLELTPELLGNLCTLLVRAAATGEDCVHASSQLIRMARRAEAEVRGVQEAAVAPKANGHAEAEVSAEQSAA